MGKLRLVGTVVINIKSKKSNSVKLTELLIPMKKVIRELLFALLDMWQIALVYLKSQ